ncbi:sugar ABC transporter permease (plasmid) [Rhizobium sp. CB3090]|uniref:carbohydrate ABC transporter permease n=1 Tax=Rhizobium sp. CB3090 TaxID=3039156 RepID=UPI0024B21CEF|nr:sugar ABC transporter permease [Rhizobium sp. CB3090]WFU12879.1 sugar ABC transporter permease [Rhizobium sp. CB3090]
MVSSKQSDEHWRSALAPYLALVPLFVVVVVFYLGTMAWSIGISFTGSKMLPVANFVGFAQYQRLFSEARWLFALRNIAFFGAAFMVSCLVAGFLLAVFLDQKVRGEGVLRSIFLFPYALSFIVTGLVWQWILNPGFGIQQAMRSLGWSDFTFSWITDQSLAIFAVAIAAFWQGSGLIMVVMLAGLRGVDTELWKAAKIDGIPTWRVYWSIVLPILRPTIATAVVLLAIGVVKAYDVVVAMTQGGPGIATDVPAKFIMDFLFQRQNIGLAMAGSTIMLLIVLILLIPYLHSQYFKQESRH